MNHTKTADIQIKETAKNCQHIHLHGLIHSNYSTLNQPSQSEKSV